MSLINSARGMINVNAAAKAGSITSGVRSNKGLGTTFKNAIDKAKSAVSNDKGGLGSSLASGGSLTRSSGKRMSPRELEEMKLSLANNPGPGLVPSGPVVNQKLNARLDAIAQRKASASASNIANNVQYAGPGSQKLLTSGQSTSSQSFRDKLSGYYDKAMNYADEIGATPYINKAKGYVNSGINYTKENPLKVGLGATAYMGASYVPRIASGSANPFVNAQGETDIIGIPGL